MARADDENGISADEIALYDRQIRLWGVNAQQRIRGASILLITLKGLGNEIAKNLVLAGIGSLTIVDDAIVREEDLGSQFLISEECIGKNRAEAASSQIKQLNPRVELHIDTSDIRSKAPAFFTSFDITIATDLDYETFSTVNAACRIANKPSYIAGVHGFYGFIFADLISHDFVIQREKSNVPSKVNETRTRTLLNVTPKTENDKVFEVVTKRETYSPLLLANTSPLPEEFTRSPRKRKQITPLLTCLRALWDYQRIYHGDPTFSHEDLENFTRVSHERHSELNLDPSNLTAEFLRSFLQNINSDLNPVAAFLGGNLAQDAINVLSGREQPLQNFLFFDGERNVAPVYALHPFFPNGA